MRMSSGRKAISAQQSAVSVISLSNYGSVRNSSKMYNIQFPYRTSHIPYRKRFFVASCIASTDYRIASIHYSIFPLNAKC
ncbi:MAG: hypothetical protein AAB071_02830 [Bacteroidota bacterium]